MQHAAVFDVFDGLAARLLKATSEIGLQLDSLSDVVSFGVAPTLLAMQLIGNALFVDFKLSPNYFLNNNSPLKYLLLVGALPALLGALRLAKFNVTEGIPGNFSGMPIPAAAISICSLWYAQKSIQLQSIFTNGIFILCCIAVFSFLMVSSIKLLALKLPNNSKVEKIKRLILILLIAFLVLSFQYIGIFLSVFVYIIISVLMNKFMVSKA